MTQGTENDGLLENLRLELRRGCLVLAVLAELRTEQYGYTLRKGLSERGLEVDEGTLYPLLRRLESQGLLASGSSVLQQAGNSQERSDALFRLLGALQQTGRSAEAHELGQRIEQAGIPDPRLQMACRKLRDVQP